MESFILNFQNTKKLIQYEVIDSSVILELPNLAENNYYKVTRKQKDNNFCAITNGNRIILNQEPIGKNIYYIEEYLNGEIIATSDEFEIEIKNLEPYYVFHDEEYHLFWNEVTDAEGYGVYQKTGDGFFTLFKDYENRNDAVLYGFIPEDEIKIKPFKRENSEKKFCFPTIKIKLNEEIISYFNNWTFDIKIDQAKASLFWKKIENADNYKIYMVENGEKIFVGESKINYFKKTFLPAGDNCFQIEAYSNDELISNSAKVFCKVNATEVVVLNKNKTVTLYWNKAPKTDGYRIYKRNMKTQEFEGFADAEEEKIDLSNFSLGETCEYKVKPFTLVNEERTYTDPVGKCKFTVSKTSKIDLTVNEAYDGKIALSWYYDGNVDGFEILKNNEIFQDIKDGLAHIYISDFLNDKYKIKGYKYINDEKIYTCFSKKLSIKNSYRDKIKQPKSYKVSVIIPAYNSQDYISRTISTVMASSIDDVELILVDDESKDDTRKIIDWYCEKYPYFVKKIFKKNGGVADTRNKGIETATGKYIAFMDNDDMIRPHGFEVMYNAIEQAKTDVIISPLYRIENDFYNTRLVLPFEKNKPIDIEEYLKIVFSKSYSNIGVWNKLYKSEIVKEHPFGILAYEDVSWTPYVLSWCKQFCCIEEVCYEWDRKIRRSTFSGVLSNRSQEDKYKDRYDAVKFFLDKGNPKHKSILAYLFAKRMYAQGEKSKVQAYFDSLQEIKSDLINNKFLWEDSEYFPKIIPLIFGEPKK